MLEAENERAGDGSGHTTSRGGCEREGGWVGGSHETTEWLAKNWGDVYLHETGISHVRRLLDNEFTCTRLDETPAQFILRMKKVEAFMNSQEFASEGGRGLEGLAKDFRSRCQEVIDAKDERIPH